MFTYKDFITKKIRKTRGTFQGWTKPTGLLHVRYAIFRNPSGDVLVPVYLLTAETKALLPAPEAKENEKV
jgi:hypothetical protein